MAAVSSGWHIGLLSRNTSALHLFAAMTVT